MYIASHSGFSSYFSFTIKQIEKLHNLGNASVYGLYKNIFCIKINFHYCIMKNIIFHILNNVQLGVGKGKNIQV